MSEASIEERECICWCDFCQLAFIHVPQILDDALKEEFKSEEHKQGDVGKQFNETVSREEVCVVLIL